MGETNIARFNVGQVVQHSLFDYVGVIVDVDAEFSGTDEWYDRMARTRPPKDLPWYHVLVDESSSYAYAAETSLEADPSGHPIAHPLLTSFFSAFEDGRYVRNDQPWPR